MNNIKHFYELIDRDCQNWKIYEYYIWWPKEVYLHNLVHEKLGIKLTRDQGTKYLKQLRKQKGEPVEGSP